MLGLPISLHYSPIDVLPSTDNEEWYQNLEPAKKVLVDCAKSGIVNSGENIIKSISNDMRISIREKMKPTLDSFSSECKKLRESLNIIKGDIRSRLTAAALSMDNRMTAYEERMDNRMTSFEVSMDNRMTAYEERMGNEMRSFKDDVNNGFNRIRNDMKETNNDITIMKDEISKLDKKLDRNRDANHKIASCLSQMSTEFDISYIRNHQFSRFVNEFLERKYQLTKRQLRFIACKLAADLGICEPGRKGKRHFVGLIRWYDDNYDVIAPKFIEFMSDQRNIDNLPP